jgi:peptide/nickel transport system substrate-binding protein
MAGLLALVAGCSSPTTTQGSPNAGKTLIVEQEFSNYDSLDPGRGVFPVPVLVDHNVYDSLLTINPHDLSKPYPSLAKSYSVSTDASTFTFHLRDGLKFANGDPLTSADVVWSLTRLKNINSAASNVMVGLTASALDQSTITVSSATPNPGVPILLTQTNAAILDSKLVQQNGGTTDSKDQADSYLNAQSAGTGPYMVGSADRTSQIVLKVNPHYWGAKPTYSTVIIRNVPASSQALDVQDGQAQLAINVPQQVASTLTSSSSVNVVRAASEDQFQLNMSADPAVSPLTANPDFRDAVRYALDYKGFVALAGAGAVQSSGFIPIGILGSLPASQIPVRDLARARADLAKVGVANPTMDLYYISNNTNAGISLAQMGTKIQSDLSQVGITVNLIGRPDAVWAGVVNPGKAASFILTEPADYPDPTDFLTNVAGPSGAKARKRLHWTIGMDTTFDALITKATSAVTPTERNADYAAVVSAANAKAYQVYVLQAGRLLVEAKSVGASINPFDYVDLASVT